MQQADREALVRAVAAREKPAIARALNLVESRRSEDRAAVSDWVEALRRVRAPDAGHRVGFTGPPGVGKSTLVCAVALELRRRGRTVGIVAVDPSSAVSGGALLGDRARMGRLAGDDGVFVRSYATDGEAGGLTSTVYAAIEVLGTAYDVVLVETVGVGQSETDVRMMVDTVCLVLQPGSGDTLQFLKAGIMEIPDVFIVQKADHEALATRALADLSSAIRALRTAGLQDEAWEPVALATSALHEVGIGEAVDAVTNHREGLAPSVHAHRARGVIEFAARELERRHGRYAVELAGGRAALRLQLESARRARGGACALTLADEAADLHLRRVRATASS